MKLFERKEKTMKMTAVNDRQFGLCKRAEYADRSTFI
jgi:hypothetical protein